MSGATCETLCRLNRCPKEETKSIHPELDETKSKILFLRARTVRRNILKAMTDKLELLERWDSLSKEEQNQEVIVFALDFYIKHDEWQKEL